MKDSLRSNVAMDPARVRNKLPGYCRGLMELMELHTKLMELLVATRVVRSHDDPPAGPWALSWYL